jgi:chromosome partitioning protein
MKIVAVINYKGGVGKTTVTANIAAELAWRGLKVLLLDLDAQASLTFSFIPPDEWVKKYAPSKTIKSWFDSFPSGSPPSLSSLITAPNVGGKLVGKGQLHLIPSHLGLINVDLELATELGGATLKQSKMNYLRVHRRLAEGLQALEKENRYDVVLIDCPPNFNVVTKTAIVASHHILIPAKPDYLSTLGIDYLQLSVNQLIGAYNEYASLDVGQSFPSIAPKILGVVFTMVQYYGGQPISTMRPYIAQTASLGLPIFDMKIRENKTLFGDAAQYGVPVVLTGHNAGTYQNIVDELEALTTEFRQRLGV